MGKITITEEFDEVDGGSRSTILSTLVDKEINNELVSVWENYLRDRTKYGDGKPVSWEDVREIWYKTAEETRREFQN